MYDIGSRPKVSYDVILKYLSFLLDTPGGKIEMLYALLTQANFINTNAENLSLDFNRHNIQFTVADTIEHMPAKQVPIGENLFNLPGTYLHFMAHTRCVTVKNKEKNRVYSFGFYSAIKYPPLGIVPAFGTGGDQVFFYDMDQMNKFDQPQIIHSSRVGHYRRSNLNIGCFILQFFT